MRVFEESASTSCAIMSEEKSLNGTGSDSCSSKKNLVQTAEQNHNLNCDFSEGSSSAAGGRLKFYKDGKFILELSHRREGEKMAWIPVPKKTYWPPAGTSATVTNTARQESTASLSVSDDNSSVQLSPWQRDHCWKQSSPRKAAGLEMTFFMVPLPRAFHVRRANRHTLKRKRRRPFDPIEKVIDLKSVSSVNGYQRLKPRVPRSNGGLPVLVQRMWDTVRTSESSVQKHSPSLFSPRKRILREFERVSLVASSEEQSQSGLKRHRAKTLTTNGTSAVPSPASSKVSSYSITSLLGNKEEPHDEPSVLRNLLRSPKDEASPEPSPKSRRNSPSNSTRAASPVPSPEAPRAFPSVHPTLPYVHHPLLYQHFLSPHHQSPVAHHSYFSSVAPYRGAPSPALWSGMPFPVSSLPHGGPYPGLVPPYSSPGVHFPWHSHTASDVKREDASTDVPLNLSKHAG